MVRQNASCNPIREISFVGERGFHFTEAFRGW
jgi:hypothetical protein